MFAINNYELFKDMYFNEINQKESINARIAVTIGIFSILVGGAIYYVENLFSLAVTNTWTIVFLVCLLFYWSLIIYTMYLTYKAFFGYKYMYLPEIKVLTSVSQYYADYYEQHHVDFYDYFAQFGSRDDFINRETKVHLNKVMAECIDNNSSLNSKKIRYLNSIGWLLMLIIIIASLTYIPFIMVKLNQPPVSYNTCVCIMEGGTGMSDENQNTQPPQPPPAQPPEMRPRVVNENFNLDPDKTEKR